eukprot:IDg15905t1
MSSSNGKKRVRQERNIIMAEQHRANQRAAEKERLRQANAQLRSELEELTTRNSGGFLIVGIASGARRWRRDASVVGKDEGAPVDPELARHWSAAQARTPVLPKPKPHKSAAEAAAAARAYKAKKAAAAKRMAAAAAAAASASGSSSASASTKPKPSRR